MTLHLNHTSPLLLLIEVTKSSSCLKKGAVVMLKITEGLEVENLVEMFPNDLGLILSGKWQCVVVYF